MTDQDIRLRCFELTLKHFANDRNVDELLEIAEKIYHFLYKAEIELMAKDELTWAEYQKKLQDINSQNKKITIKV